MSSGNKTHNNKHSKKEDKAFHSKNIKHDPNAESARAVFGRVSDEDDR
ncbi:CPC_1213 family protein [Oscillospiraceae bacterium WX1]